MLIPYKQSEWGVSKFKLKNKSAHPRFLTQNYPESHQSQEVMKFAIQISPSHNLLYFYASILRTSINVCCYLRTLRQTALRYFLGCLELSKKPRYTFVSPLEKDIIFLNMEAYITRVCFCRAFFNAWLFWPSFLTTCSESHKVL